MYFCWNRALPSSSVPVNRRRGNWMATGEPERQRGKKREERRSARVQGEANVPWMSNELDRKWVRVKHPSQRRDPSTMTNDWLNEQVMINLCSNEKSRAWIFFKYDVNWSYGSIKISRKIFWNIRVIQIRGMKKPFRKYFHLDTTVKIDPLSSFKYMKLFTRVHTSIQVFAHSPKNLVQSQ